MKKRAAKRPAKIADALRPPSKPLLLGEYLRFLSPNFDAQVPPTWPPDAFALCLAPLWKSSAYGSVLNDWPPSGRSPGEWAGHVEKVGESWGDRWADGFVPAEVTDAWPKAFAELEFPLADLPARQTQCQRLLELAAIADHASMGLGIPEHTRLPQNATLFQIHGSELLADQTPHGTSLCESLDLSRIRVLPKMHCPQSGLTIRSFSHHLALCVGDEIRPMWHERTLGYRSSLNVLFVPWPYVVTPRQFRPCDRLSSEAGNIDREHFGFFAVDQSNPASETAAAIIQVVEAAKSLIGDIHGVVLPELAISDEEHMALLDALTTQGIFLVAGVGVPGNAKHHPSNEVRVTFPFHASVVQRKHHRWKLEQHQIGQYGLGSRLNPEIEWWEHIATSDRRLGFFSILPWLVASVLICEDLARPDPVGDLVRAVGPNLVIALLMDGPQLKDRWSARYATALADDPGCSVLSVTSLGMARLSRPRGVPVSGNPVVAIWKDAKNGGPVQIDLPSGHHGLVFCLTQQYGEEWSADGRSDHCSAGYPALSGVHPVKVAGLPV